VIAEVSGVYERFFFEKTPKTFETKLIALSVPLSSARIWREGHRFGFLLSNQARRPVLHPGLAFDTRIVTLHRIRLRPFKGNPFLPPLNAMGGPWFRQYALHAERLPSARHLLRRLERTILIHFWDTVMVVTPSFRALPCRVR